MVAAQAQNYIIQLIILKLQKTTFPKKERNKLNQVIYYKRR